MPETTALNAEKFARAPLRNIDRSDLCDFYHTVDVPGHGTFRGQWDLRGGEAAYLGGVNFNGKSVLEIGPASGHLSFWMEAQGSKVTSFELSEDDKWDFVPFHGQDLAKQNADRKYHLQRIQNSWWFLRNSLNAKADVIYSNVYDIDSSLGIFDVVTINSVLLHLRDPLRALINAASVCGDTIIVTDVAEEQFFRGVFMLRKKLLASFIPRASTPDSIDAWFFLPSTLIAEMLQILGFKTTITKHKQRYLDGAYKLYTVVGRRP